jgi:TonB family protein
MGTEFTISKQVTFSQPKDSVRAITAGPLIHPKLLITGQICTRVPNNERTRQSVKLHDATTTGDHRLVQKSLMVTKDTKGILDRSMGGVLHMKILSLLLLSSIFVVGQTATSPVQHGNIEILSDTQGVDFGPYLQDISKIIRHNWYILIPESAEQKKAEVAIEFAIAKDGHVSDMRLSASSGDAALDRPAWGSITNSNPFPLLPREFKGPYLALRLHFAYNLEKNFLAKSAKGNTGETAPNSKIRNCSQYLCYRQSPSSRWRITGSHSNGNRNRREGRGMECYRIKLFGFGVREVDRRFVCRSKFRAQPAVCNPDRPS